MRSSDFSEIREGTRKGGKQHGGEEGQEDSARMLSVQSDGGFPIKLQIKTHILLEWQWGPWRYHESRRDNGEMAEPR